jgi:hypothetical protein
MTLSDEMVLLGVPTPGVVPGLRYLADGAPP